MTLYKNLEDYISNLSVESISDERKKMLQPLVDFIRQKVILKEAIRLNFICTHNARRSHLSQVWAQTMAYYSGVERMYAYSGGAESTTLYPAVAEILNEVGFQIDLISGGQNPVYGIKYAGNEAPVIGFSKKFDDAFNPVSDFAAIMVCSEAAENCPFVAGAVKRISVTYEDPKSFDNSSLQAEKYAERSTQIATEMYYIFSQIQLS